MKTIIKSFIMAALMCVCFTSCDDEAKFPDPGPQKHPELETAGVYEGTWLRVNTTTQEEVAAPGSMTLTAGQEPYTTKIRIQAPAIELDKEAMANIFTQSSRYAFQNNALDNPFGNGFSGTISWEGAIQTYFKITIVDGRKRTTFEYTFQGQKVQN